MNFEQTKMLIQLLGMALALIYLFVLKPYIDAAVEKFNAEKEKALAELTEQERQELMDCAQKAVDAAEQVLGSKAGKKKKEKVLQTVTEKLQTLTHLTLTAAEIDDLIEAFVFGINAVNKAKGE